MTDHVQESLMADIERAKLNNFKSRLVHCPACGGSVIQREAGVVICSGQEGATHNPRVCFPKDRADG